MRRRQAGGRVDEKMWRWAETQQLPCLQIREDVDRGKERTMAKEGGKAWGGGRGGEAREREVSC